MAVLAWQGWQLSLPPRWDPIKLEGGFDVGYALLADTHRPRLAIRWRTLRARDAKADRIRRAMRDEVGILAAGEATAP